MWVVFPENASGSEESERYRLLVGRVYTVGRKDCDITILNDQSISRRHAELFVTHHETSLGHPHKLPMLTLKDTSKLGTMIGEGRICSSTKPLNTGDVLLFGTLGTSKYKVVYEPYNVTASCLDAPTKKAVKKHVLQLGGHLVNDWRKDCQLLVMSSLSVTVKVICAMISQKTVVTPAYLVDLIKALETKAKEPDPTDYIPTLAESQLDPNEVSFRRDERRKTLLQGKIFVFLQPKQFKKLSMAIELAGGMPMLMEEGTDDNEDDILVRPESCVMYCDAKDDVQGLSQNAQEWVQHVETVLKRHKKRFINDSEIGYAVLFCCTDKYCNPGVDLGPSPSGKSGLPSQSLSQSRDFSMSQLENTAPQQQPSTSRESRTRGNPKQPQLAEPLVRTVTIKEEPVSQPKSSRVEADSVKDASRKKQAAATRSSRKRGRADDEAEDEDAEEDGSRQTRKSAKRDVFDFQSQASVPAPPVKTERVTPRKETAAVADSKDSRSTRRQRSRSKSPSPDPGPPPRTRQTRAASRSPSPKPSRHKKSSKQDSPTAKQGKQPSKLKQETLADSFEDTESRRPSKRGNTQHNIWDSDEDDDNEDRARNSDNDPFADNRFGHSSKATSKKTKKEVPSTSTRVDMNVGDTEDGGDGESRGDVRILLKKSPATPRNRHLTRTAADSSPTSPQRNGDFVAADGFLSKPTWAGAGVKSEEIDGTLPVNVVVTECVSLVARRPNQTKKSKRSASSVTMWNGKQVPNFKKFRKTANAGDSDLPQIIGGSDLVVYTGSSTKEQDDMFAETLQMESQQAEQDRRAKDLFSWDPPTNKKTRRGRH